MANQSIYTVGGTVQAGGGVYIRRNADDELLQHCRVGEYAFILSSRQVGKSSLMVRTSEQLEKEDIRSVIVDLSGIGVKISADEWYLGILDEIANTLNLKTNIFTWWSDLGSLSPATRMTNFFREVMLKEVSQPVVIFFDEIDSTLSIPFADDFFASLRAIYNARSTVDDFKRLSFVMIGVATPSDLIADSKRTPFNIGYRVELTDFTLEELQPLAIGLGKNGEQILGWVFEWTNGHPYLTQRLCSYLSKNKDGLTREILDEVVKDLFLSKKGMEDNNLQFVRDMLTKRAPHIRRVLTTYKKIRIGHNVIDDERSIPKSHLKIAGVVRSDQGLLRVRNEIYRKIFDLRWIQENTPQDWIKITAFSFGILTFILLFVFVNDLLVENSVIRYSDNFYRTQDASIRLEQLAKIFDADGYLPNTDYDYRARELFFILNAKEQEALFTKSSPDAKNHYLPTVVRGLYVTMANVEGGQDSTNLLSIIKVSLESVDINSSLYREIDLWLQARGAITNEDALSKYDDAIELNSENPSLFYERALVRIRLEQFEQSLSDFDAAMRLAQLLSSEASEASMATPTDLFTATVAPQGVVIATSAFSTSVQTPVIPLTSTILTLPTQLDTVPVTTATSIISDVASAQPTPAPVNNLTLEESYRSSFYSRAYIRSAVEQAIQSNLQNSNFQNLLINPNNYPDLVSNGLLPGFRLSLAVQAQNGPFTTIGQTIAFQYTVTNSGNTALAGPVFVTDTKVAVSCPAVNTVGDLNDSLDPFESLSCVSVYTITQDDLNARSVTSTAGATAGGVNSNVVTTKVDMTLARVLELTATVNPTTYNNVNQDINFAFIVRNSGTTTLGPAQFIIKDSRLGTVNCGAADINLLAGASVSCAYTYTTTEADRFENQLVFNLVASGGGATTNRSVVVTVMNTNLEFALATLLAATDTPEPVIEPTATPAPIGANCVHSQVWTPASTDQNGLDSVSVDSNGCYSMEALGIFTDSSGVLHLNNRGQRNAIASGIYTPITSSSVIEFKIFVTEMYIVNLPPNPVIVNFAVAPLDDVLTARNTARFKLQVETSNTRPIIYFALSDVNENMGTKVGTQTYEYGRTYTIRLELVGNSMRVYINNEKMTEELLIPTGQKAFYIGYTLPIAAGVDVEVQDITIDGVAR